MRVTIQTTVTNHLQEHDAETQEIETSICSEKPKRRHNGKSGATRRGRIRFKSVLTKPFALWDDLDDIVGEFLKYLDHDQRRNIIKNLIRFLELKVIMEEYSSDGLLSPSEAVAHVWHVLILETELYRDVVHSIQDFHGRPHRFIHHALFRQYNTQDYHQRLQRTQRLFKSYYGVEMPTVFAMDSDKSDLPTSVTMEERSMMSESFYDFTFDTFENKKSKWYSLLLPSCYCLGSQQSYKDPYDEEDVSLLTSPLGLQNE